MPEGGWLWGSLSDATQQMGCPWALQVLHLMAHSILCSHLQHFCSDSPSHLWHYQEETNGAWVENMNLLIPKSQGPGQSQLAWCHAGKKLAALWLTVEHFLLLQERGCPCRHL